MLKDNGMKKTYTKKQITEAIAYWQKQLKAGNYKKVNESEFRPSMVVDTGNDTYMITTNDDGERCIVPDTLDEIQDVIDAFNINMDPFIIDSTHVNDEYETDDPQDALDYFASKLSYLGGNGGEAKYRKGVFGKVNKFGFYFTDDDGSEIFCDCSCML